MRRRLPALLVAAWLFAVLLCGVLLWTDRHFVMRTEGTTVFNLDAIATQTFGCFESTTVILVTGPPRGELEVEGERFAIGEPEGRVESYADFQARARDDGRLDEIAAIFGRLSRAGVALFALACAAPLLGLIAMSWRRGRPAVRHVLLLMAALAPLAALEHFGVVVDSLWAEVRGGRGPLPGDLDVALGATPVTWWARIAWGNLAVAATISWWRWPKPHRATPVDPEVFE